MGKNLNIVTGGSRGIGKRIALKLAENDDLVVVLDTNVNSELERKLTERNRRNRIIECSVDSYEQVRETAARIEEEFSTVDVLVNNAGIVRVSQFEEQSPREWEELFQVNAIGVLNCSQVFGEMMMDSDGGKIVNVASTDAMVGRAAHDIELGVDQVAAYSASKGAVISFTKSLAVEWGEYDINVNALAPVLVETPRTQHLFENEEPYEDALPLMDTPTTTDVARAVKFLSSDHASSITGQVLRVDCGYYARGKL